MIIELSTGRYTMSGVSTARKFSADRRQSTCADSDAPGCTDATSSHPNGSRNAAATTASAR
jgi:hypothetical protein